MGIFSCCPPGLADTFAGVRIGIAGCGGIGSNAAGMLVRSGAVDWCWPISTGWSRGI